MHIVSADEAFAHMLTRMLTYLHTEARCLLRCIGEGAAALSMHESSAGTGPNPTQHQASEEAARHASPASAKPSEEPVGSSKRKRTQRATTPSRKMTRSRKPSAPGKAGLLRQLSGWGEVLNIKSIEDRDHLSGYVSVSLMDMTHLCSHLRQYLSLQPSP